MEDWNIFLFIWLLLTFYCRYKKTFLDFVHKGKPPGIDSKLNVTYLNINLNITLRLSLSSLLRLIKQSKHKKKKYLTGENLEKWMWYKKSFSAVKHTSNKKNTKNVHNVALYHTIILEAIQGMKQCYYYFFS